MLYYILRDDDTLPEEVAKRVWPRKKAGDPSLSTYFSWEFELFASACGSDRHQNIDKSSRLTCNQTWQNHSRHANLITRLEATSARFVGTNRCLHRYICHILCIMTYNSGYICHILCIMTYNTSVYMSHIMYYDI
jgi:hypothetical protein